MKQTKIYIHGLSGRMGQEIKKILEQEKKYIIQESAKGANALIDFTSAEGFRSALETAEKLNIPLVSGSTGLQKKDFEQIKSASKKIPILWSPNMSLGIAALMEMIKKMSSLKDYDFYIEETHHADKKDAPSGTAIQLQNKLEETIEKKVKQNISLRGGGVFGQHRIIILGKEETLVLQHDALSRTLFARGAVKCLKWILNKKPGYYKIEDIL